MEYLMKAEHRLKEFGSEKCAGSWRKLHKEKLRDLYSSPKMFLVLYWREQD
jgi:hypothetical protein